MTPAMFLLVLVYAYNTTAKSEQCQQCIKSDKQFCPEADYSIGYCCGTEYCPRAKFCSQDFYAPLLQSALCPNEPSCQLSRVLSPKLQPQIYEVLVGSFATSDICNFQIQPPNQNSLISFRLEVISSARLSIIRGLSLDKISQVFKNVGVGQTFTASAGESLFLQFEMTSSSSVQFAFTVWYVVVPSNQVAPPPPPLPLPVVLPPVNTSNATSVVTMNTTNMTTNTTQSLISNLTQLEEPIPTNKIILYSVGSAAVSLILVPILIFTMKKRCKKTNIIMPEESITEQQLGLSTDEVNQASAKIKLDISQDEPTAAETDCDKGMTPEQMLAVLQLQAEKQQQMIRQMHKVLRRKDKEPQKPVMLPPIHSAKKDYTSALSLSSDDFNI